MSREPRGQQEQVVAEIPPFWITATDHQDREIDQRVIDVAHSLWPWAFRRVERELNDGARAAELLESVAVEVSARLKAEPKVGRNLKGYFFTAFQHRVRSQVLKESRLEYEGLLRELEKNHKLRAPDWVSAVEKQLTLKFLLAYLPHNVNHMVHCRMLGFSWKKIGRILGISAKQAKSRCYYGVQKAYETMLETQSRRRHQKGLD
jgi:DNA-directed RNA polymerase specialized sigma24 family protein